MINTLATFEPSIRNRIKGLDELRGIAVILVMIDHGNLIFSSNFNQFALIGGYIGVDLFFIISGYLIAHILINSVDKENYFRKFYVRRIFRIWPIAFLFVFLGVLLAWKSNEVQNALAVLPFYLTFTQNYITPFELGKTLPGIPHFWSLAIEEQFYLFLPFLFYFINRNKWPFAITLIALASLFFRLLYDPGDEELNFFYTNIKQTYYRLHFLGIGVMLALSTWKKNLILLFASWLTLLVIFRPTNGLLELPVTIILTILVIKCVKGKSLINSSILAHLGKICFGLYVIHFPIVRVLGNYSSNKSLPEQLMYFVAYIAASYILARLSFKYFEIPIQNLRTRYEGS